jgi:hypothetical protein
MAGQSQPLRHEHAVAVEQRRRVIHVVFQDARVGRAEHGQRHLVGDTEQRVFEQFEFDRVADHLGTWSVGPIAAQLAHAIKRDLRRGPARCAHVQKSIRARISAML